jgi:hypothetical protein
MSLGRLSSKHRWFRRLGLAAVAAMVLGTVAIPTAPADAALRAWVGPGGGVHLAIVQHPHHDWWRHPYGYYGPGYDRPYGWYR